jgi:outer membrane protein assembly factor BamB
MSEPYFILLSTPTENTVKVTDAEGNFLGNFITPDSGILGADSLALGDDGTLYLSGVSSQNVLRFNPLTGDVIDQFAPDNPDDLGAVPGITFGPDGNLYVSNFASFGGPDLNTGDVIINFDISDNIQVFDGDTGDLINTFEFPNPGPAVPIGLDFGEDGYLYATSRLNDAVYRYNVETGEVLETEGFLNSSDGGLDGPADILFGPDGNTYISSLDSNQILRYDAAGNFIDVYAEFDPATELQGPSGLQLSPDGEELVVTGFQSHNAARLDFATGEVIDVFIPVGGDEFFGGPGSRNAGLLILTAEDLGIQPEDVFGTTGNDDIVVNSDATNPEQFFPTPKNVFADLGDDLIDASVANGGNTLYGGEGNDTFFLGYRDTVNGDGGNDRFFVESGGRNIITGGEGADAFWIANAEVVDAANIITDFDESDVIGIGGLGISSTDGLGFTQEGEDVSILYNSTSIATVQGIQVDELTAEGNFVFA